MRNPYQVLREKELELQRVEREIEALRLVGSLLEGEETPSDKQVGSGGAVRKEASTGQIVPEQKWP